METPETNCTGTQSEIGKPWFAVVAVADLMFVAKITSAAKQANCQMKLLQNPEALVSAVREVPDGCAPLVIVDLNHLTLQPIEFIRRLRSSPDIAGVPVLGYLSHTQVELKREAEQAGCNLVLPRSVFSQNINDILRRQSCHLDSL